MTTAQLIRELEREGYKPEPYENPLTEWSAEEIEDMAASLGVYA